MAPWSNTSSWWSNGANLPKFASPAPNPMASWLDFVNSGVWNPGTQYTPSTVLNAADATLNLPQLPANAASLTPPTPSAAIDPATRAMNQGLRGFYNPTVASTGSPIPLGPGASGTPILPTPDRASAAFRGLGVDNIGAMSADDIANLQARAGIRGGQQWGLPGNLASGVDAGSNTVNAKGLGLGNAAANLGDDAANAAGTAGVNLSDDVARGGLANYLKNYGSAALTTLNPTNYRGGNVPFADPSAGTFLSWANMASKIPGTGRLTGTIGGLARYGVGSGLAAGVGIPLVTNYLQGDDTGTGMDNVLEAIGAGASGGSAFGPVGSLIGGAGVGIGQGVTELVRGTGLLGEGRKGSFVDIISNTDNPITSTIGGMFGGDEGNKTALKLNPGTASDITTNQVGFTPEDRLNAAFDSLNLDQQSRADLTNKYQSSRAMLQVQYEMDPTGFAEAFEASTGVPFDPANLDQYAMQDIVTSYLPSAVEQQSARLAMLQRAAQYQAMLTPYLQPIQDDYNHLASLTSDPRVASLLSAQGLATERSMRALPQLEAMTAYQSQYNQLAQQQFQDSINPSTTTDPLSAASVLDASLLPTS